MSGGILRFPWTRQPQVPVGIDLGNSFASTLNAVLVPDSLRLRNVLNIESQPSTVGTMARVVGPSGVGLQYGNAGGTAYINFPISSKVANATQGYLFWKGQRNASGAAIFRDNQFVSTGTLVWDNGSSQFNVRINGTTQTGIGSFPANQDLDFLITGNSSSCYFYVNGTLVSTFAVAWGFNGAANINLHQNTNNASGVLATDYLWAFGNRLLSAQEAKSLSGNPWQLFAPIQRTIWVPAAAGGAFTPSITEAITLADTASQVASLSASITEAATLSHSQDAIVGYAVSATETLNLSHSQTNVANFPATITEAMTLADTKSAQFGATSTISEAMTLADSSSNVAALSASITESMTLADSPNASATGDYTATQTEAMSLADTASNVAALSASITEPMSLADSSSNVAALSRSISEALTLADTVSSSAAGDYTATITEAVTLSDSSSNTATLSAAITESATLADTSTASSPGNFAASISESLALAEIASNQAALSAALVEALSLADNAASAWSRVVSLTETMTLSDSASQALNAIVTESVWWSYSVDPQDLHYSVEPQDLTFSIATLALAGR